MKQILEEPAGPGDTVLKGGGVLVHKDLLDLFDGLDGLRALELECLFQEVGLGEVLKSGEGSLGEGAFESIPGPLKGVLDLIGEVLQGADGDCFFWGIL